MKRILFIATTFVICHIASAATATATDANNIVAAAPAANMPATATPTTAATAPAAPVAVQPAKVKGAAIGPQLKAIIDQYPTMIKRIQPLGKSCLQSAPCALAAAALAPAADGKPRAGDAIFNAVCSNCHGTGLLGSPKFGDKAAWAPRIAKGLPMLYTHAMGGFNAMPARGGNSTLSDAEVKNAVDYMTSKSK